MAQRIRAEVIEQEWDWHDLANTAGVGVATVTKFLEYGTKYPHAYTIWRLANALELDIVMENR